MRKRKKPKKREKKRITKNYPLFGGGERRGQGRKGAQDFRMRYTSFFLFDNTRKGADCQTVFSGANGAERYNKQLLKVDSNP